MVVSLSIYKLTLSMDCLQSVSLSKFDLCSDSVNNKSGARCCTREDWKPSASISINLYQSRRIDKPSRDLRIKGGLQAVFVVSGN